jgi:hypothetical protein
LLQLPPVSNKRLRTVTSRSGLSNIEVDGAAYHSPYDPAREAEKFCATLPVQQADVVMVFGWGLGYLGDVLQRRVKHSARVIVFEPDEELFKLSRTPADSRFQFVTGARVCQFLDQWALEGCRDTDEFLWLMWPAAARLHPALAETLTSNFRNRLRDRAANLLTHFNNGALYFRNAIANFEHQADPDVGSLFGRFKNLPLVIVSAGPSLDRNINELRTVENRCFLLAVDTALRPLLAAGVVPHAVIAADPSELNARHVTGVIPAATYLIAEQAVHPGVIASASRRMIFGVGVFPDSLLMKFGLAKSRLEVWGSVATAALDLACRMAANPIIFAGQDFAYSWKREYASHTIFHDNPFDAAKGGPVQATDIWNRQVHTTENLIAYRDFFVRKMRQTPHVRFINATEGGILTEGVEILPLKAALDQSCNRPVTISLREVGAPQVRQVRTALEHLHDVLRSRKTSCDCFNGFLELTAREHLLKQNKAGIEKSIQSGLEICEKAISLERDSYGVGGG